MTGRCGPGWESLEEEEFANISSFSTVLKYNTAAVRPDPGSKTSIYPVKRKVNALVCIMALNKFNSCVTFTNDLMLLYRSLS